jgi:hypothetical protein
MTETELRAALDNEIRQAVGYDSSELANQRRTALEYYYGEPFGNETEGRSAYVSRDVADTIEWIMPSLMRIFTGGDTIVRFEPQGPEDEQKAQQATDYVNHVFQRQNDGFLTLYTWFKDALLSKNGFVKVYWENYTEYKTETYENLTDDEFAMLLQDPDVEPVEHTEDVTVDPMGVTVRVHALKVKKKTQSGKCCVIPVPPEEVLVNRYPVSPLKRNRFICHRRRVSISEVVEMGLMSKEEAESLTSYEDQDYNEERIARYSFDETDEQDAHASSRYVWLAEAYWRVDADGDGIAELRKITMAGDRVIENEEVDSCPFVTITPIILPHKLYGMSVADLVMDLQLLKSTVFRQILDNMYLANNGRYMALDGMVNIDDLLTSRPGGIVRVKTFDAVKPMQPPLLGAPAFNLLEYIDVIKENRTGVTRYNQGIDADSLNKTATGINQIMSAAQARVELIARVFAETGVKDLFYAILENVQKHQDQAKVIRLRNEWVAMDPREWTSKFDLSVMVGLGTGSKDMQIQALMQTVQFQMAALQGGLPIVQPVNIYNTATKLLEAQNIKGADMFFTHPDRMPPAPPQQDPKMVEVQAKMQADQAKLQIQAQKAEVGAQQKQEKMVHQASMDQQRMQLEREKAEFQAQMERDKAVAEHQREIDRLEMEKVKLQLEMELERAKAAASMQLEREKAASNERVQREKAKAKPKAKETE